MTPPRRPIRRRRSPAARRGTTLLLVVVLTGAALALSLSFLHTGMAEVRMARAADRTDAARRAARAGLMAAVARLSDPDWDPEWAGDAAAGFAAAGPAVGPRPGAAAGYRTAYRVAPAPGEADAGELLDAALTLRITCVGEWVGADGGTAAARAAATVRLAPRTGTTPGGDRGPDDRALTPRRQGGAGDWAEAWDSTDRDRWRFVSGHAVFAAGEDNGVSFEFSPQVRVAGDVLARSEVRWPEFGDEDDLNEELHRSAGRLAPGGRSFPAGSLAPAPAPLGGVVRVPGSADDDTRDLLNRLKVPLGGAGWWTVQRPRIDDYDRRDARPYRLFAAGPEYRTAALADLADPASPRHDPAVRPDGHVDQHILIGGDLGPTPDNPLGIFFHDAKVTVKNAAVTGTLTADKLHMHGDASVRSVVWGRAADRGADPAAWPRPPAALVETEFKTQRDGRVAVAGAVVCRGTVKVDAGSTREGVPSWGDVAAVNPRPPSAPGNLTLRLGSLRPLGYVPPFGGRPVRLRLGDGNELWPVVWYDAGAGVVELAGAADAAGAAVGARWSIDAPVGGRARFEGPVLAKLVQVKPPWPWDKLKDDHWEAVEDIWEDMVDDGHRGELLAFLARPESWDRVWQELRDEDDDPQWLPGEVFEAGLPLFPTVEFVHHPATGAGSPHPTGFAPPLFAPDPAFAGTGREGLRWEVLAWDEFGAGAGPAAPD